jgi:peptidoglycan hydrolase-like protein with peptidoglycan-binding domain
VQRRLIALGYLSGYADGDYGNMTKNAVIAFQKRNGLNATGAVNSNTLAKLNSSSAKKAVSDSSSSRGTERLNWFNGGSNTIPKGATFKVKDCKTGKVFTCKRWSGYNHLDAEPLTYSDMQTMLGIYGHWSWRRRPILVKYNGHVYAASMNGMPHGTATISNNGFDGHFCIHFYKTKTHGTGLVDDEHQNCVEQAMNYSW